MPRRPERGISREGEPKRMPAKGRTCTVNECGRPAFSRGMCRPHYRRVARGLPVEDSPGPKVGVPSGFGQYGRLDTDGDGRILCHECGRWYVALGVHVGMVHGSVREYRLAHGLRMSESLAAESLRQTLAQASAANGGTERIREVSTRERAFVNVDQAMITRGIRLSFDTADDGGPVDMSDPVARQLRLRELRDRGMSLRAIGRSVGLSGERVRQILIEDLSTDILAAKKYPYGTRMEMVQRALEYVRREGFATVPQIAEALDIPYTALKDAATDALLSVTESSRKPTGRTPDKDILAGIRAAAALHNGPLTRPAYTALVVSGRVEGRSISIISRRFGSWRTACDLAGVESYKAKRPDYGRTWDVDELRRLAAELIMDGHANTADAERALRAREDGPSMGLFEARFGSWARARDVAHSIVSARDDFWQQLADESAAQIEREFAH